ncbi:MULTISPECIES: hypothetical protein [Paenibacillus]|uniref:hypothetical protein n=1 Tax=Paenibacillus TaxID=44249 RepID=UPI00020D7EC5|nr:MULTISPECIES: hypothetical protein [Paenibacillus]EGL19116.1 hypothetical protein HMPREF9413_0946 [Paenibacillus sp. HGF7]EPD81102.1 hypothetical protein HMPREF1207_04859 [Paenibacillus sp. HGH0039]MBV6714988.1 hypothetical protein [Paenibacillus chitinolyticus]MEC0246710.1 hypothetical protein [Paenibacillus chitinolyticus]SEG03615.1 hypothetical protein SAMN02799616_01627 [Paenibacillus sp. UNC499MF]
MDHTFLIVKVAEQEQLHTVIRTLKQHMLAPLLAWKTPGKRHRSHLILRGDLARLTEAKLLLGGLMSAQSIEMDFQVLMLAS